MDSRFTSRAGQVAGRIGLLGLLVAALAVVGAVLSGCGQSRDVEPVAGQVDATAAAFLDTVPSLPTPAATLLPPASPTPAPTTDPALLTDNAAVQATQTAAVSPPTPPISPTLSGDATSSGDAAPPAAPLPTPYGVYSWTLKVPILMYHYISQPPADADVYRVDLSVTPDNFRQQLAWLRDNGYTAIDYYDLSLAIVGHIELPEKPVLLTFDDGYLDNYTAAFPLLQEYGYKGTFFIVTDFVDLGREGYMTWPMIEELSRAGHRIEPHSRTHPDLRDKDRDGLIWELLGSQQTIAAHIGYTPRYFCYPGGDYNAETIQLLRELEYWGAVTTANDTWHGFNERFEWGRLRIRNNTTLAEFANVLDLEGTVRGKRVE